MSIKKFASIIFALALITGMLAACASPTPTPTTAAPATSAPVVAPPATAVPATAAPATAAPATAAPATAAPAQPTATTAPATANVTLSYLVSQGWASDAEQALAKKFTQQSGIAIDYQVIPSDQYFNVLKTKLNSGDGPDLFGGQSGKTDLVVNYDVAKNAVDLSGEPWA